jgi:PilZ domain-containing protein
VTAAGSESPCGRDPASKARPSFRPSDRAAKARLPDSEDSLLIPPAFRHTNVTSSSTAPPSLSSRTMGVERRGNARTSVDCDVQLITATAAWPARLTTISRVGALLRLEHGFPTGTPLHVAFGAPAVDGVLELRGQVVRTEASEGGVDVAVMFAPLNPLAFEMVDSLIASFRLQ